MMKGIFIILGCMFFLTSFMFGATQNSSATEEFILAVQKNDVAKVKVLLMQDVVDVNCKDKEGFTPLMFASINNYKQMTELLLTKKNIDLDAKNVYGYKAITLAAIFGNSGIIKILKKAGAKE